MKPRVLSLMVALLTLWSAGNSWSINFRTYDPHPNWGGLTKVFYEGWGFASGDPLSPPAASVVAYRVDDRVDFGTSYGRGWSSIGPNHEAWVANGVNGTRMQPKPPYCHLTGSTGNFFEANEWTNTDSDGGSRPFAGPTYPYSTGAYADGKQVYPDQAVWLDVSGKAGDTASGPRSQILLRHDVPNLADPTKLRADVLYRFLKNANQEMGYGIRIYFEKVGGGEAYVDFGLHFYKSYGGYNHYSTFGWRVVGITEHPEWSSWTDTPAQMHTLANEHTWKQVAIDCGQVLPGGLTFMTRGSTDSTGNMEPESAGMVAAYVADFTQYVTRATAIAVGQVDESFSGDSVGESLWMDDVIISEGIVPPLRSILEVKNEAHSKPVQLLGAVVTGAFYTDGANGIEPLCFTIQHPSIPIGIRVISKQPVAVGDKVDIIGQNTYNTGERVLQAAIVIVRSQGNAVPNPLCMTNRAAGGGAFGQQGAVADNTLKTPTVLSAGLSNVGVLMKLVGRVTNVTDAGSYAGYFYIDDGSGLIDGAIPNNSGIRCRAPVSDGGEPGMLPNPLFGDEYIQVIGVMGCQDIDPTDGIVLARYFWTLSWSKLSVTLSSYKTEKTPELAAF